MKTMAGKHVVIIGAGLGGIAAAIKLQEAGHTFTILEKLDRVGGTWAQNTYPGCACDVAVALYQYSFAQSMNWTRLFPQAAEIQAYADELVDRYQLRPSLKLSTPAAAARWDGDALKWSVSTEGGEIIEAAAVIGALGQLNRPFWPEINGAGSFKGETTHSAAWDHSIDMAGKRVGVIGSAASAVQLIPEVAKEAAQLTVFQRTPNWMIPRNDRAVPPEEMALMMTVPEKAAEFAAANRKLVYENADYFFWQAFSWTPEGRAMLTRQATDHLHAQVPEGALRDSLTPDYPIGCKRVLICDDFYPTLLQDHVDLVTDPITKITETGITTTDGTARDFDVIIYSTGFETTGWKWSVDVTGASGQSLNDVWADAPEAYLGITVADFPNFFVLYGPNTNLGHNSITFMLERQVEYVIKALAAIDASGGKAIAPSRAAQDAFNAKLQTDLDKTVWADPQCVSWYKNADGKITQNWSDHTRAYEAAVAEVKLEDYDVVG